MAHLPAPPVLPLNPLPLPALPGTGIRDGLFHAGAPFSAAELQAMALDGLLQYVYGETYLRRGFTVDPGVRARAAVRLIPPALRHRVALGRQSAAWIYGCAAAPPRLSLLMDHGRRTTAPAPFSATVIHEVALGPLDLTTVAGAPVTTPLRTALDIALHGTDGEAVETLRRIAREPALHCPLVLVRAALQAAGRTPRKQQGLARLDQALKAP